HLHRYLELAHEVRQEEHGAFQHAHQHEILVLVVPGDLGGELAHPPLEGLGRDEDLPDRAVAVHRLILRAGLRPPVGWHSNLNIPLSTIARIPWGRSRAAVSRNRITSSARLAVPRA